MLSPCRPNTPEWFIQYQYLVFFIQKSSIYCVLVPLVVVAHKILHRILREELFHLPVQLCSKRLICHSMRKKLPVAGSAACLSMRKKLPVAGSFAVRNYQSRHIKRRNHVRHRKGLPRTRHAQQSLELVAFLEPPHQLPGRMRLVAHGLVLTVKDEWFLFNLRKSHLEIL